MANPSNVEVIIQKLVAYLKSSVDVFLRKDLVPRIIALSERLAPSNLWYHVPLCLLIDVCPLLLIPLWLVFGLGLGLVAFRVNCQ